MYSMFQEGRVELVLFTDALVTRGTVRTGQHRVTDILNQADDTFLVLEDVTVDELGSRGTVSRVEFAQVNLDAVLFAVATTEAPVMPELRTAKQAVEAMISIPPFKVTGKIHLLPSEDNLRDALTELTGRFFPVTEAAYWSDSLHEPREPASMVAVNRRRAQILAPHRVIDPWAGDPGPGAPGGPGGGAPGGPETPPGSSGF